MLVIEKAKANKAQASNNELSSYKPMNTYNESDSEDDQSNYSLY